MKLWVILDRFGHGLQDVPTATIVCRNCQIHCSIVFCTSLGRNDQVTQSGFKSRKVTYHTQANPLPVQFVDLFFQRLHEKTHQKLDLVRWTTPVLRTEREQREVFDP